MLTYQDIIKHNPLTLQGETKALAAYILEPRKTEYLKLLEYLEKRTDFYTSPASRNHHQAYEGGLHKHSLEVVALSLELNGALQANLPTDSLIICGIVHDLGKCGSYIKNQYKGKMSYRMAKKDTRLPVPVLSLIKASSNIALTEDEEFAILYHDGLYVSENVPAITGHETPLYLILHYADMWSGREMGERCLKQSTERHDAKSLQ